MSSHSCRNRACPKCHGPQTKAWLDRRRAEMLPVPYFHVTVTVPEELRAILRRHQKVGYGALIKLTAGAIVDLARNPRWLGGTPGVLAVLHTWTQRLIFHPHVHCLVTGGGLADDGAVWKSAADTFLFPKSALASVVRARFRDALAELCPHLVVPQRVWKIPWVVHITPWGHGEQAVLDYLARYVFRIAITNNRILAVNADTVTWRYTDRATKRQRRETVPRPRVHAALSPARPADAASTRSDTTASGTPLNAATPPRSVRCCNSRRHPSSTHQWTPSPLHVSRPARMPRRSPSR